MKSVLISIKPKWCELIASGKKTVEVRKTKPKLETPFKCYIYETKALYKGSGGCLFNGRGKVIGEFICDRIDTYEMEGYSKTENVYQAIRLIEFEEDDEYASTIASNDMTPNELLESPLLKQSCLTFDEIGKYVCGKKDFGFHTFYGIHISDLVIYDKPKELSEFHKVGYTETKESVTWLTRDEEKSWQISRPPQSWCYIEMTEVSK